ncbi:unnamed protein product [Thelazia callipaeda]|uniref:non-specific serine/threonine protein kinase n=1 Tax=Thelazia callipaeda TaxID=103827 RepID=A0A158RC19_THECL|nr:unnamed protein product [Thelazia callipaeda]
MDDILSSEDTGQLIYEAVIYNNEELLRELLKINPGKVHYRDKYGKSALHIAAQNGSVRVLDLLIKAGADVNSMAGPNALCATPLHIAAVAGRLEAVRYLIEAGAELLATDLNDHCALELAQMSNQFETACLLIDAIELDRDRICQLHNDLIKFSEEGDVSSVIKILPNLSGANSDAILNGATLDRKSAACLNGRKEVVEALLNVRGHTLIQPGTHDTMLHASISSQDPIIVEMILKAFTHLVSAKNVDGSTALHWASQCGNLSVVKLLMEFPYDEDVITKIEDVSGRFTYRFVLDVNALDSQCRTALYLAVANSHYDVVKYLLEVEFPSMDSDRKCPVQIDVYCRGGRTPLMVAAANGNIAIVKLLVDHGADVNLPCGLTDADISSVEGARCIGSGALSEACRIGSVPLVQYLFQQGAVDHENIALSTAFKFNQEALVRLFLLRLAFVDPEYRVNKKNMDFGQMSINRNLLPSTVYPTTPCMLNWHNASLETVSNEWLVAASLQVNQRLRTSRMALAALTRIDLSKNKMKVLAGQLLQLPSIRNLNLANNEIKEIELPRDGFHAPLLESLSLEYNKLSSLPNDFFTTRLPMLSFLDVSHNELNSLPETLWFAPRLRELNVSNNALSVLPAVGSSQPRPPSSISGNDQPESVHSDAHTNQSTLSTDDSLSTGGRNDDSNITVHELKRHNVWQTSIRLAQSDESDNENGTVSLFSTLSVLNLSRNYIKIMPSCLACCCPKLTRLNISHNQLSSLGPVECLPSRLRHLDVSNNHLVAAFEYPCAVDLACHAVNSQTDGISVLRHTSPARNSRSRSKSAVRSQRSLSVARVGDFLHDTVVNACPHKQHARLESLRTLYLSNNKLMEIPLFAPKSKLALSPKKKQRESRQKNSEIKRHVLFPTLTTLDISNNCVSSVPAALSNLVSLSVLNLSGNSGIEILPAELGLLSKLWNLSLKGCQLRDPLRNMVHIENYKTVDLIAYLKSVLEDSRPYTRLKLMIVGVQGIGKTSLLQQIRLEGTVGKRSPQNDSWSKRMGHTSGSCGDRTAKGVNISTVGVDIAEWTFEPKKTKGEASFGPLTFRTWDFGGQREYYATHQYFLSRRSLYVLVWKVSDGEAALPDLHQWLVNIQARAPNSPVIIVGTHVDQIFSNPDRFPLSYLDDLNGLIRERFVMVSDADKKGLPYVVESLFVSSKTKQNIRTLCNLIYRIAYDIRTAGSKERLLDQKIPASYLALEKIVDELRDERRSAGIEPLMRSADFRRVVQERMLKNYGRAFRDDVEFNHACSFLHENGVMLHYEDVTLKELYFLDPQWLCDILAHVITIREINPFARNGLMKIDDLQVLFKSLNLRSSAISLRSHIISLLQKFEVALCWQSRSLLIPSLLPDEYQLRGGYPGSRVTVPTKASSWHMSMKQNEGVQNPTKISHSKSRSLFCQSNFGDVKHLEATPLTNCSDERAKVSVFTDRDEFDDETKDITKYRCTVNVKYLEQEIVRRIYMMAYVPSGFWSRLMTRVLMDDHITMCIERLLQVEHLSKDSSLDILKELCNEQFRSQWLLWQTGFEILAFGETLFTMRQFLPLAEVKDVHYELVEWRCCGDDSNWHVLDTNGSSLLEIIIPAVRINLVNFDTEYVLRSNRVAMTRLLALIVDIMDTLLEDWYPLLGTRFVHTSEGRFLVNRLIPCISCAANARSSDHSCEKNAKARVSTQSLKELNETNSFPKHILHTFTIEECILSAHDGLDLKCPLHLDIPVMNIAPDTVFLDISDDYLIQPSFVKRGKLIGRGAFGFVFKAALKFSDTNVQDAALKMLEPVEPGLGARATSISAYKAACTKWQRDPLQNACRAYCNCRQELNVLASLQHSHITSLLGVCPRPLALLVELAPLGALNHLLSNYRRSGARLHLSVIQDTASQVAKALEYLHEHRIIYRDLKCENVLTWRFPPPFSIITDVHVKLGDYGISRSSFPSGGAKGLGGTEGFMAPEIMRYNGEQEYTEKVDCFSFSMFLYELISLKLPFDGHEQLKEYILDGGRPQLTPSELLYPCNVLDVMVVCWAAQPFDRPSASQIVSMTTAPEFTHLLDVISLNDPDSSVNAGLSFPRCFQLSVSSAFDDVELGFAVEDSIEGEVWMSRSDGSITVVSCNQYGWLDSKSIVLGMDKTVVLAMCLVNDNVWLAESTGMVRIYCRSSYSELWSFSISRFLPTAHLSISVISLSVFSTTPLLVLITLPSALLLVKGDRTTNNPFVSSVALHTIYSSAVIDFGTNARQIWVGHEGSSISVYNITVDNGFMIATDMFHDENHSTSNSAVTHLITCTTDSRLLWSVLSHGSKVYQWSTTSRTVQNRLDVRKILPSSESISTLDIEASRDGYVSALALLDRTDGAQLYIGTSRGAIIVAQAVEMRPLAAFRPYMEDVHTIIVLDMVSALNEFIRTRRDGFSISSIGGRSFGAASGNSSSDLLETVSWVKDRVSETVNRFRQGTTETVSSVNNFVVTVGNGYRCLIDRFTDRKHQGSATRRRESHCAIIWRTDEWVS